MSRLSLDLDLVEALGLWLLIREHEREESVAAVHECLRAFLYDRLSIEEMEKPEQTWALLKRGGERASAPCRGAMTVDGLAAPRGGLSR